ncbi:hypothetical protein Zmor_015753 [Zophobas morio]|uniref:Uncharacterized protein n=1 Tax=Zophobas morio TaxID=2755281 RepID=A0AA38IK27_9CUCU|nr:hypothetical protein Zmor_015753 [Zophobas morio]
MLAQQILPGTQRVRHLQQVFYIQDQISSHIAHINVVYLNQYFPAMLEWKVWSVHSRDLNPWESFLLRFLHDHLYSNNTSYTNRDALKQAVQQILSSDCNANADQHA